MLRYVILSPRRRRAAPKVDMLAPPSAEALRCCRQLLCPSLASHEVLAFGPREDLRRLRLAGVLPALGRWGADGAAWVDVQLLPWGLGPQPSLRAIVLQEPAGRDKRYPSRHWGCPQGRGP